jgi:hypothetical protein
MEASAAEAINRNWLSTNITIEVGLEDDTAVSLNLAETIGQRCTVTPKDKHWLRFSHS